MMSLTVKFSDEMVETFVLAELQEQIKVVKRAIAAAKRRGKKLRDFEKTDLVYNVQILAAMQLLVGYYGRPA
jgi:hypothetical protein